MDLREKHIIGEHTRERIVSPQNCPALETLGIRLTGLSEARPPFGFARLRPDMGQMLVCLDGAGRVLVDGRWTACAVGQAYLSPPRVPHAYHAVGRAPWRLAWVMFFMPPSHCEPGRLPITPAAGEKPKLVPADGAPLAAAIEGLYREASGPAQAAALNAWAQVVNVLARCLARPLESDARLWRVWEAVGADLAAPWDMPRLAALAHVSAEHLRRLCLKALGESPMRHVTTLRMERAAALLGAGAFTIEEVAYQVGYENAFAFSTAFKRRFKVSPSEYRKKN